MIQHTTAQVNHTQPRIINYIDSVDLPQIIRGKKAGKKNTSGIPQKGKLMYFLVPTVGSNPLMGFFYGVGFTGAMYLGNPETTNVSNLSSSISLTTKNQVIANVRGTIMTNENKWEMLLDLKYAKFTENTYGLGSDNEQPIRHGWNIGEFPIEGIEGSQPLEFNQWRFHYTALRQIKKNIYGGLGYHLDSHKNIHDVLLDLEAESPVITSHYAYNTLKGIDPTGYSTSGVSANFVFDSRDHTVNTYRGNFIQVSYRINSKFLASATTFDQLYLETRLFKSLSKERPRHILGFWGIGHFIFSGEVPYMHLPFNASDMRNRIGRGYVAGRFRGQRWVTAETEYRFPITRNGLLGGVVFGSVTTTSRESLTIFDIQQPQLKLFEATRPAGGIGARVMLNKTGRLNLAVDMAFGQEGARGFYFAVGETF
ncbi:BamA/TamA family outer membrane protein [Shivajiella indica]|uniref:BamA/TamA family outer membrane protein n=1 Tax=Shivajiella indica TaxID=872115 RepID=A0ABW5BCE4_9BACT